MRFTTFQKIALLKYAGPLMDQLADPNRAAQRAGNIQDRMQSFKQRYDDAASKVTGKHMLPQSGQQPMPLQQKQQLLTPQVNKPIERPASKPQATPPQATAPASKPQATPPQATAPASKPQATPPQATAPASKPQSTPPQATAPASTPLPPSAMPPKRDSSAPPPEELSTLRHVERGRRVADEKRRLERPAPATASTGVDAPLEKIPSPPEIDPFPIPKGALDPSPAQAERKAVSEIERLRQGSRNEAARAEAANTQGLPPSQGGSRDKAYENPAIQALGGDFPNFSTTDNPLANFLMGRPGPAREAYARGMSPEQYRKTQIPQLTPLAKGEASPAQEQRIIADNAGYEKANKDYATVQRSNIPDPFAEQGAQRQISVPSPEGSSVQRQLPGGVFSPSPAAATEQPQVTPQPPASIPGNPRNVPAIPTGETEMQKKMRWLRGGQ